MPESTITNAIEVQCRFVGMHRWKNAPDEYRYLRSYHRHEFHVTVKKFVHHDDRDEEFCHLKAKVAAWCEQSFGVESDKADGPCYMHDLSCEQMANQIAEQFDAYEVKVSEDGENAGIAYRSKIMLTPDRGSFTFDTPPDPVQAAPKGNAGVSGGFDVGFDLKKNPGDVVPVNKLVRTQPFIGIEAEGPAKGAPTLFIPGNRKWREVEDWIKSGLKLGMRNLYIGAGNQRGIMLDVIKGINDMDAKYSRRRFKGRADTSEWFNQIFIEFDASKDYKPALESLNRQRLHAGVVTILYLGEDVEWDFPDAKVDYMKWILGQTIVWQDPKHEDPAIKTDLSDPRFKTDVEI